MSRRSTFSTAFQTSVAVVLTLIALPGLSDDTASVDSNAAPQATTAGTRRAFIVCGLSGDAEHHKLFSETIERLQQGLTGNWSFSEGNITILFGDAPAEGDSELIKSAGRATREQLEKSVVALRQTLQRDDSLWVIVMGHSHCDGTTSWLNLPGPDIHQSDFGKLFDGIVCREQLFFVTTPTSGFYIKPLSTKGRVVITATEVALESNETEFPHEFARILQRPPENKEFDVDQDGAVTVYDLYLTVARNLAQSYLDRQQLATEHSLLDDNGDGRGTEVQIDYLTDEQGGRAKPNRPVKVILPPAADGVLSKTILLRN